VRKILVLNNDLDLGGGQKSLIEFLAFLDSLNSCEVDLLVWQKNGPLQKKLPKKVNIIFQEYSVTLKSIKTEKNKKKRFKLLFQYLKFAFFAKVFGKSWFFYSKIKKKYDIVISYSHSGYPPFFAIDRASAAKKFMWYHHGVYSLSGKKKELDGKYFVKYDKIVAVSSSNKIVLKDSFPELEDKLIVIPNIINASSIIALSNEPFQGMHKDANIYNFVTVSRFSKEKGLDLAVSIASELKMRGLQFKWYFVGDGELFSAINDLAKKMNVTDVCVFVGSKENPYPYFKNAELYIQTTYVEAHPITISEALILKKMIVTTDLPATREVLQDGKLGLLCAAEPTVFAENILKLLHSEVMQKKLKIAVEKNIIDNEISHNKIKELLKI